MELEEIFVEIQERSNALETPNSDLCQGLVYVCIALSNFDEDQLTELSREDCIQTAKAAAVDAAHAGLIAVAYRREATVLRDAARSEAAAAVLAEARGEIERIAVPEGTPGTVETLAVHALGRARLAVEEAILLRLLGRYDQAFAAIDGAEREVEGAAKLLGLADRVPGGGDPSAAPGGAERYRGEIEALRAHTFGRRFEIDLDLGLPEPARQALRAEKEAAARSGVAYMQAAAHLHGAHLELHLNDFRGAEDQCLSAETAPWWAQLGPDQRAIFAWERAKSRDALEWVDASTPRRARGLLEEVVAGGELRATDQLYALCTLARHDLRLGELDDARVWLDAARVQLEERGGGSDTLDFRLQVHWLSALEAEHALARRAPREELMAARVALEEATSSFLATWAGVRSRSGGIGFLHLGRRSSSIGTLVAITRATAPKEKADEEALGPVLRALAQGALARSLAPAGQEPEAPPDVAEIRSELLPPGGGMLVYLVGGERGYVFAIDREEVVAAPVPSEHEIERLRDELVSYLHSPPPAANRGKGRTEPGLLRVSAALGDALVPESIRARVEGWDELVVCGLSTIKYLPFEVLSLERGFVGDLLPLWYLASPSLGRMLLRREAGRQALADGAPELLLFAAPESGSGKGKANAQLHWSDALQERVVGAYPRVTAFVGAEATYARLALELRERPPAAAHLVVHGVGEREAETHRVLLLSPEGEHDGRVRYDDLLALRVPSLVLLSSCGAGAGRLRRGDDGIDDLGGALMRAGAATVVLSVHEIHFDATMKLMGVFHRHLAAGESVARASFEARRALAEDPDYSHPYFRSLVHVTGAGDRRLSR